MQMLNSDGKFIGVICFVLGVNQCGDYVIIVVVQDSGDGDVNQVFFMFKSFVVLVKSLSEVFVILMFSQVVVVVGIELCVLIFVVDLDQDVLNFVVINLFVGVCIDVDLVYGYVIFVWMLLVGIIGNFDISFVVIDFGLSLVDFGYVVDLVYLLVFNILVCDLCIVVCVINVVLMLFVVVVIGGIV